MVFKREEELVQSLAGSNVAAVKTIKNLLIGDKNKKASFVKVGAVPRLVEVVQQSASSEDPEPAVQALAALGSFAFGSEIGLRSLLASPALSVILSPAVLSNAHPRVVEAACRALKQVYSSPDLPPKALIYAPEALSSLLRLLHLADKTPEGDRWLEASELSAQVLAATCCAPEHQEAILALSPGGLGALLALLSRPRPKSRQAGLDLLSALVLRNATVAALLLRDAAGTSQGLQAVLQLARSDCAVTRLKAAQALTALAEAWPAAPPLAAGSPERAALDEAVRVALGLLLRMAADAPSGEAPRLLARLLASSESLQRNACGTTTLGRLIEVVKSGELQTARQKEGVVRAIASFCLRVEENRRQVAEGKLIPLLVAWVEDAANPGLRAAACDCIWALSRSFKALRGAFTEVETVKPLVRALEDAEDAVRTSASAALCNMVLEYSPLKEQVVQAGAIGRLTTMAKGGGAAAGRRGVRINALWALENLVFMSKPGVREAVRKEVSWDTLVGLAQEGDSAVQEKAFGILQNLLYGGAGEIQTTLEWSGQGAPGLIQQRLASGAAASTLPTESAKVITNALYAAVNIATGTDAHKDLLLSTGIAACLPAFVREDQPEEVQVAALWCLINLTWIESKPQGQGGSGLASRLPPLPLPQLTDRSPPSASPSLMLRLEQLRRLGLEDAVRALTTFRTPLFVRERAQGVMDAFARVAASVQGGGGSGSGGGSGGSAGSPGRLAAAMNAHAGASAGL